MTLSERCRDAWSRQDARAFGALCERLRFVAGYTYLDTVAFVADCLGREVDDELRYEVDDLLYHADLLQGEKR